VAKAEAAGVLDGALTDRSAPAVQERFAELCALAYGGNDVAMGILRDSAVLVSRAVSAVTNVLDVDRVVFGGPFWTCLAPAYLELIPDLVAANSATGEIHGIDIVGTGVGEDVGAVGAACLVLEHTLAPRSQRLLLDG